MPLVFGVLGELALASTTLDDVAFAALGPFRVWSCATPVMRFAHPARCPFAAGTSDDGLAVDAIVFGQRSEAPVIWSTTRVAGVAGRRRRVPPVAGIDPRSTCRTCAARGAASAVERAPGEPTLDAVVPACRRALAYEMHGCTNAMLTLATEYAKVRRQFGQPIGAFQAVKHRLADFYVARQAAAAVVDESWRSDPAVTTIAAKALAGRPSRGASEHCLQVLGAIGFTHEHDLHRFVRRGQVLDALYGSGHALDAELGRVLLARGRAPGRAVLTVPQELDTSVKSWHTGTMTTTATDPAATDPVAADTTVSEPDYRLYDADEHYYEAEDALTRHLDRKYRRLVNGSTWTVAAPSSSTGKLFTVVPNPTYDPVGVPGSMEPTSGPRTTRVVRSRTSSRGTRSRPTTAIATLG